MNILFVSYHNPLGQGGFEKQTRGLFRSLIEDGHRVACFCIADPNKSSKLEHQLKSCGLFDLGVFTIEHQEKPYKLSSKILFWFAQKPGLFLAQQFPIFQQSFQKKLDQIKRIIEIDVIHYLGLKTAYFLPQKAEFPVVLDLVDSRVHYKKRAMQYYLANKPRYFLASVIDFCKTFKLEKDVLETYSNYPVAVVSAKDANLLTKIRSQTSVHTVCHPVTLKDQNYKPQATLNKKLVFYGFMDHVNSDAMFYLIDKILPIVRTQYPQTILEITGYDLPLKIEEIAQSKHWIKISKRVNNINLFLASATLTCWPFRYGSGVKNKILESMYMGKPIVTTTIGAEAFTEKQKRGMLIADRPQDLANHIINLLNNQDECFRLGEINRQIVTADFTWKQKAQDYLELYKIAQKHNSKPVELTA